jgi:hypothetical protein
MPRLKAKASLYRSKTYRFTSTLTRREGQEAEGPTQRTAEATGTAEEAAANRRATVTLRLALPQSTTQSPDAEPKEARDVQGLF